MTSIEWLESKLPTAFKELSINKELFKQAKEMEMKQRESDFVDGYKERAIISNLIFDEASEKLAKQLFSNKLENQ